MNLKILVFEKVNYLTLAVKSGDPILVITPERLYALFAVQRVHNVPQCVRVFQSQSVPNLVYGSLNNMSIN